MSSQSIGQQLVNGLTTAQTIRLLDAVFALWDSPKVDKLLARIDTDTAVVLSRVLRPDTESAVEPVVSDEKFAQAWQELWGEWEAVALEIGDEEGEYAYQDADWEPPYFDGSAVAADLEPIAQKMLPMLEKVHALGLEQENIFRAALQELEANVAGYPEWMGAEHSEFCLGSATTRCVLQWEWLIASETADAAATFIDRIRDIPKTLAMIDWEEAAFVDFFRGLPEKAQQQLYDYFTAHQDEPQWREELESPYSVWSTIYQAYAESFNPQAYLDNCRRLLPQDWRCGRPLIDDALTRADYASAAQFLEQTLARYIQQVDYGYRTQQQAADWQPEDTLLMVVARQDFAAPKAEINQLLEDWIDVADRLKQTERTAALRLQQVVYDKPYQWDGIARVFHEQERAFPALAHQLIAQWQTHMANSALGWRYNERPDDQQDAWLLWLLQAGLDQAKGEAWFAPKLKTWLAGLGQHPDEFKRQLGWVYLLTGDVAELAPLAKRYPELLKLIRSDKALGSGELAESRRRWLASMHGEQFADALMVVWQRSVAVLVPDPAAVDKADYTEHARWLKVCQEFNPGAYREILNYWQVAHKRRRNLWEALKRQGLGHGL